MDPTTCGRACRTEIADVGKPPEATYRYTYDGSGRFVGQTVTDATGHIDKTASLSCTYRDGRLTACTSDGRTRQMRYERGKLIEVIEAGLGRMLYTYDAGGRVATSLWKAEQDTPLPGRRGSA